MYNYEYFLKSVLNEYSIDIYKTANFYHFVHSLSILLLGVIQNQFDIDMSFSGISFLIGILLFSGSLYSIAIFGVKSLGMITPIGGLLFIIGWCRLGFEFYKLQ